MPLVQLDPAGQLGEVVLAELGDVRLDAEVAEQGRGAAQRHRHVPAGLVRERRRHVRAQVLRRHQLAGPALDRLPGQGVGHVGGPDPLDAFQHGQVDPAAAGRAGLPLHLRVPRPQLVEQRVHRQRLVVRGRGAAARAAAGVDDVAVAVPLDVGDLVLRQQAADPLEQVAADLGPGQVENQLVPLQRRHPVPGGQDPVRVRAVQIGVGVDHLGLDPEPELHAAAAHVLDEPVQPARPDVLVDPPVAQAGLVAAAPAEPAVVQDEPFHAEAGGGIGQRGQLAEVVTEVDRFPDVEVDRARRARVRGPRAQVAVELGGQVVQAGPGGREVDPRGGVRLAFGQGDLAGQQQLAAADGGRSRPDPLPRCSLRFRSCPGRRAPARPGARCCRSRRRAGRRPRRCRR